MIPSSAFNPECICSHCIFLRRIWDSMGMHGIMLAKIKNALDFIKQSQLMTPFMT